MRIQFIWPGVRLPGWDCHKPGKGPEANYINHGLSMLSAVLKRAGHECFMMDLRSCLNMDHFYQVETKQSFDLTIIGVHSVDSGIALTACEIIKRINPPKPIIMGGPHVSVSQITELPNVDCIVWGEGEITIHGLLNQLDKLPKYIQGEAVDNLDGLPFVDRTLFNNELERSFPFLPPLKSPFYTINIGRGCPNSCSFCHQSLNPIFTKKVRYRSVENYMAELDELDKENGKINGLMIHDDCFPNRKWNEELINKWKDHYRIPFWCQIRADWIVKNKELIPDLARIGLTWVSLGCESGSQRMLNFLNKNCTVEKNIEAAEILHDNKINIFCNMIFCVPTETQQDIIASEKLLQRIRPEFLSLSTYTCYPGSALYKYCVDNNLFLDDHYSMVRYPYERKVRDVDYDFVFRKIGEFQKYKNMNYYEWDEPVKVPVVQAIEKPQKAEIKIDIPKPILKTEKYPKISIILTSHNRPVLVREAIQSIKNQTMEDWELIIIDDYSTVPEVLTVLEEEAKSDKRIKVYQANYDVDNIAVLWNCGLDLARGEYIAIIDDDCRKKPDFFKLMSEFLENNKDYPAVSCCYQVVSNNQVDNQVIEAPINWTKENIMVGNYVDSGSMMIRKSTIFKEIGWFDERFISQEDWDMAVRIIKKTKGYGTINKSLNEYRWHNENRMHRSQELKCKLTSKIVREIKNYGLIKIILFTHEKMLTLSQMNVVYGILSALKTMSSVSVSYGNTIDSIDDNYDVGFVIAPFQVTTEMFEKLDKYCKEIMVMNIEDPHSWKDNLKHSKYYDYVFTNDIAVIDRYKDVMGQAVGFCPSISVNDIDLRFREVPRTTDILFLGFPYESRINFMCKFARSFSLNERKMIFIGDGWDKQDVGGAIKLPTLGEQASMEMMESAKIVICQNRAKTDLGGNLKAIQPLSNSRGYFEAASGALVIIDDSRKHNNFNGDLIYYKDNDLNDLLDKVNYYLKHDEEREVVGKRAKQRALTEWTYKTRMNKVLLSFLSRRYDMEVM